MRVLPAIRVKGRIAREVSGFRKTLTTARCGKSQKRAGSMPSTFGTLIYPEPRSVSTSGTWSRLSSNDGKVSKRLPARSDSPDLIDGGPDGRGYSPRGHFRQAGNA
jgi:hypothetical protein